MSLFIHIIIDMFAPQLMFRQTVIKQLNSLECSYLTALSVAETG
jgi:hypothetical protein